MKKLMFLVVLALSFAACDSMESNYSDYLKNIRQYSPRVTNLKAEVPEEGVIILTWTNPESELAVKIMIDTGDNKYEIDEMISTHRLENLEIKGYTISVYTEDKHGNLSVPAKVQTFPTPRQN